MPMYTRHLMTLSAALLALFGTGITFFSHELLSHVGVAPIGAVVLLVCVLGTILTVREYPPADMGAFALLEVFRGSGFGMQSQKR